MISVAGPLESRHTPKDLVIIKPMMATPATSLPSGPEWTYEVKWDGYRTLAVREGTSVRLISRNLKNVTSQYPTVVAAVETMRAKSGTILDGEVVAVDEHGRPSFQALQHRAAKPMHIQYYAFDMLTIDGREMMRRPLEERRERLARIVDTSGVLLSEPLPGTVRQIQRTVKRLGLEGVVAKRLGSVYVPGRRSDDWIKVRFSRRQEFVVGGYKPAGATFDSILVGYYDRNDLRFAGKVRAGFTPHLRAEVFARLVPLKTNRCPLVNSPNSEGRTHWGEGTTAEQMAELQWVKPRVVVEVSFTEWTGGGNLRHAAFVAVREDKPAGDVRRES